MSKALKIIEILCLIAINGTCAYLVWNGASFWWFLMSIWAGIMVGKLLEIIGSRESSSKGPLNGIETK